MNEYTGSCLCGEVQYQISSQPLATRICWCRDCQMIAANGTVNITVTSESIRYTGSLHTFLKIADSGDKVERRFCPECGTHIFSNSSSTPEYTVVRVGTLSDPSSVVPSMNIWVSSAPKWACLDMKLDKAEKQPLALRR